MTGTDLGRSSAQPVTRFIGLILLLGIGLAVVSSEYQFTRAVFTDTAAIDLRFQAGFWPSPEPEHCVRSMGYWKNHPEAWPVEELKVAGVTYPKVDAKNVLETSPKGDATYILAHQLIPALLNIETGADASSVQGTVDLADVWLTQHVLGSDPGKADREEGISLAAALEEFNTGLLGPRSCDEGEASDASPIQEPAGIFLETDPTSVIADGESVVTVKITLDQGAGHDPTEPVDIALTTSLGTFAGGATQGVVQTSDGHAQITLYVGTDPGTAVIMAIFDDWSATATVEFMEPAPAGQGLPTSEAIGPSPPTPTEVTPTVVPSAEGSPSPTNVAPTAEPTESASEALVETTPTPIATP